MKKNEDGVELYPLDDLIIVGLGIPVVLIIAVVCAYFVTSYAGI